MPEPLIEIDARQHPPLGMPPSQFLRDYWQKRPLLIRNAFPDFKPPLTPEDLAGLACEDSVLSRIVRHDRNTDAWELRQGPFAEEEFPLLPRSDWTLLVQDVDKWDVDVARLLQHFAFLPRWRIDDVMVSFAAPGGSVGAHVDQYDVFLLQGAGQRRWQIDAGEDPDVGFRDDVELRLLRRFSPSHEWVLQPGDMLYLPPGVPHHGVAVDACLTFSIGMRAPAQSELLIDFAEHLAEQLPESSRYADPDLDVAAEPGEIDAAAMARVMRALPWVRFDWTDTGSDAERERTGAGGFAAGRNAELEQGGVGSSGAEFEAERERVVVGCSGGVPSSTLRTWFGCFITRYRSAGDIESPPRVPDAATVSQRLAAGATLHLHPHARVAFARDSTGAAELFVDGESHRCSLGAARRLSDPTPLAHADFEGFGPDDLDLVQRLVGRGTLALSRVPRRRPS